NPVVEDGNRVVHHVDAYRGEAGVSHRADGDRAGARAELQQVIHAAVVEHIGRRDRAFAAGEGRRGKRLTVIQMGLGNRECSAVELAARREVVERNDDRVEVHAQLREVGEIALRVGLETGEPKTIGRVARLADEYIEDADR